jgi:hypothetical protein
MNKANKPTAITKYQENTPQMQAPPEDTTRALIERPPAAVKTMEQAFDEEIAKLISQAGTIELTAKQREILYKPVEDEDVEIRPDGLVFLPWPFYVDRLHEAFGFGWTLVPKGMPKMNPGKSGILWGFFLMIEGKLMGFAIGEQEYHESNLMMTWSDACEGAKSNALMRLCKERGISNELWHPAFIRRWKEKYAECYKKKDRDGNIIKDAKKRDKLFWRKKTKDADESEEEEAPPEQKPKPVAKPTPKPTAKRAAKPAATPAGKAAAPKPEKPKPQAAKEKKEREPGEDEGVDKDPEMERAITSIKKKLLARTVDTKDFKHWLFEGVQQKMERQFVVINQFGQFSFHVPPEYKKDTLYLDKNLDKAIGQYVAFKIKESKEADAK